MSSIRWTPNAPAIAQVSAVTLTGYDATTTYSILCNSKTISVVGQGGTVATTAAALLAALQAALATAYPEFNEVTWSVNSATITATSNTAGKPFTFTSAVSGGGGTIGSFSTSVTSSGPNDWSVAGNWSTGAVPVSSDSVYFDQSSVPVKYGLAQSAVTLTLLSASASYTGYIGLPETNVDGSTPYIEYRGTYLAIGATTCNIGDGVGQGMGRCKLDTGSVQTALNVRGVGASLEPNLEPLIWKGTHASNAVEITSGTMAIAGYGGDAATVLTLRVGYQTSPSSDVTLRCGAGLTLTTLNMDGGQVTLNSAVTTVNKEAGTLTIAGTGAVTTLNENGGTTYYLTNGTLTTLNVGPLGSFDCSQDDRARTVSNCVLYPGAAINDPSKSVTWSSGIVLTSADMGGFSLVLGIGRTISPV